MLELLAAAFCLLLAGFVALPRNASIRDAKRAYGLAMGSVTLSLVWIGLAHRDSVLEWRAEVLVSRQAVKEAVDKLDRVRGMEFDVSDIAVTAQRLQEGLKALQLKGSRLSPPSGPPPR